MDHRSRLRYLEPDLRARHPICVLEEDSVGGYAHVLESHRRDCLVLGTAASQADSCASHLRQEASTSCSLCYQIYRERPFVGQATRWLPADSPHGFSRQRVRYKLQDPQISDHGAER